jgi:hypothetical protein
MRKQKLNQLTENSLNYLLNYYLRTLEKLIQFSTVQQTNSTNKFAVIRAGRNHDPNISSPVGFMKGHVKGRDDIPRPYLIAMLQIHLPGEKHNSEKRFFFRLISRRRRSSNQSGTATLLRNIISSTRRS